MFCCLLDQNCKKGLFQTEIYTLGYFATECVFESFGIFIEQFVVKAK